MAASKELSGRSVAVGIRAGKVDREGADLVMIAAYQEFGTKTPKGAVHIPPRPAMRLAADEAQAGPLAGYTRRLMMQLLRGTMGPEQVLDSVGMWMQQRIRSKMRKAYEWAKPNAPSTIKAKKSSKPLIDHGDLVKAVDYEKR